MPYRIASLLLLSLLIFPLSLKAQKKIANKIYKYGQVAEKVKGKVLISFEEAGPKTDNNTVSFFKKKGADAISWNELFIPGVEFSAEDFAEKIADQEIETIVIIEITNEGIASYNYSSSTANASAYSYGSTATAQGNSQTYSGLVEFTASMSLKMSIYTLEDDFAQPVGVLIGSAVNDWGALGTAEGIVKKIVKRMLKGLESEGAFK